MVDSYSLTYSVGWMKCDAMVVTAADLIRATVETKGADGHGLVKLVGVTAHVYSRSVTRMRQKTRRNATGCLSFYSAKKGARMMRGPSRETASIDRLRKMVNAPSNLRATFIGIATAAWPGRTRDWIWDLAAGAMPVGRSAMLPTSRCLYCIAHRDLNSVDDPPKNSIAHVLRCPRHKRLVDWTTDMCASIGAPGVQFSGLLLFGHGGSSKQQTDAVEAIRGAAAAALRLARNACSRHMTLSYPATRWSTQRSANSADILTRTGSMHVKWWSNTQMNDDRDTEANGR